MRVFARQRCFQALDAGQRFPLRALGRVHHVERARRAQVGIGSGGEQINYRSVGERNAVAIVDDKLVLGGSPLGWQGFEEGREDAAQPFQIVGPVRDNGTLNARVGECPK
ncbi:MAG TPA: hypothetical protein VGJ20_20395 [Xanthobacteraceae bacterium]